MYFKKARSIFVAVLASTLMCTLVGVNHQHIVNAETKTVAFPMRKGDQSLANSPTAVAPTSSASGDNFLWYEQIFDSSTDLTSATYIGVEFKNVTGNPGLTLGVMSNGTRFGTYTDGKPVYFVKQDGTVAELSVLYSSVNLGTEAGMILLPMSSLSIVGWGDQTATLSNGTSFFMETNSRYNWAFSCQIGEVGYYTGDPFTGAGMTKVLDLSQKVKKDKVYNSGYDVSFPENEVNINNIAGLTADYPFRKGDDANKDSMIWVGTSTGDSADNWQTIVAKFDEAADLTNATYFAVEYYAKSGTPGLTYGIENYGSRYSNAGFDGNDTYMLAQDGSIVKASTYLYDASNVGLSGCLLIPMDYIDRQWGTDADTLAAAKRFIMTTNSKYNWAFEVGIGELGYYTGRISSGDFTFHKLLDLTQGAKVESYSVSASNPANASTMYRNIIEQMVYGDTTLVYTGTGKRDGSLVVWDGGAKGQQTMTKDSYGDDALKLESTGAREGADAYTAFTLFDGMAIDWSNAKGVTLWARNDSDIEVSFNLEFDVMSTKNNKRARFNISQGNRFWLYDVNDGTQKIYMTRPCVTLPVGFEGWVRIPFEAFNQAPWSVDSAGTFEREYFMSEGCTVPYGCITVFSTDYTNKPFSVNKLGGYTTTPSFISALVPASDTRKDIKALMGL